jgi:hypothetical protein
LINEAENRPKPQTALFKEGKMAKYKLTKNLGLLLLGIWLILSGLMPLLKLYFNGSATIMQVLAIVAGALIMLGL